MFDDNEGIPSKNRPVKILFANNYARISGTLPEYAKEQLEEHLAFVKMGCEHVPKYQSGEWDGMVHLFNDGEPFMTGLLSLVRNILDECGVKYTVEDRRKRAFCNFPELEFTPPDDYRERDYQGFTVSRAVKLTRGILNLGTGGGKTILAAQIIATIKVKPFVFYTLTKDLLHQAIDVLSTYLNCEIGQVGDGVVNIKDITVCTKDAVIYALNKKRKIDISKYRFDTADVWDEKEIFADSDSDKIVEMVKQARGVLFDEVHHASSTTCKDVLLSSDKAYWRYGATATLMREDGEELIIQGLFGKKIVDISLSYLIKNKWLTPCTVFFVPISFESMLYRSYQQIYSHCVTNNEELSSEIAEVVKYLVNLGKSNLILVTHKKHGEIFKKLIPGSVFLTGKDSSKKRTKAINDMRSGKLKVLIATSLADEGLDIKNLDVVHMTGAGASITRVPQRIGRVVRKSPGKRYGIAIYYHYCTEYLYQHGFKAKQLIDQESALDVIQCADIKDMWTELVRFMNKNETLFE